MSANDDMLLHGRKNIFQAWLGCIVQYGHINPPDHYVLVPGILGKATVIRMIDPCLREPWQS